jgi:hypothetical protein
MARRRRLITTYVAELANEPEKLDMAPREPEPVKTRYGTVLARPAAGSSLRIVDGQPAAITFFRDVEALRIAIRAHDSFATEEAWDRFERWIAAIPLPKGGPDAER